MVTRSCNVKLSYVTIGDMDTAGDITTYYLQTDQHSEAKRMFATPDRDWRYLLTLDLETGAVAIYSELLQDGARDFRAHHGVRQTWPIPGQPAIVGINNHILDNADLAQALREALSDAALWRDDGQPHGSIPNDRYETAAERLNELADSTPQVVAYSARDYFEHGDIHHALADHDYTLSADTTDAELRGMADTLEIDALSEEQDNLLIITAVLDHLREEREDLRDELRDELRMAAINLDTLKKQRDRLVAQQATWQGSSDTDGTGMETWRRIGERAGVSHTEAKRIAMSINDPEWERS